jgi:alanine dehydrogenase
MENRVPNSLGIPKEVKNKECRVGLTPAGVKALLGVRPDLKIVVQVDAGTGAGYSNEDYSEAGAVLGTAHNVWGCDMVMKVKEPVPEEFHYLREDLLLFTYLHLADCTDLAKVLLEKKATVVDYGTVRTAEGRIPMLVPMSEVAGRMAAQVGARYLEKTNGGKGILMGGTVGTKPALTLVLGTGAVSLNAAKVAAGMGSRVVMFGVDAAQMEKVVDLGLPNTTVRYSDKTAIAEILPQADLVISGVLIPGYKAPRLITEEMVKTMQPGSVIIDVAIDQGGSIETAQVTTHDEPVVVKHGVIHYGVANMPGAVPRTSTEALVATTLPYAKLLVTVGLREAAERRPELLGGVNVTGGHCCHPGVAEALGVCCERPEIHL